MSTNGLVLAPGLLLSHQPGREKEAAWTRSQGSLPGWVRTGPRGLGHLEDREQYMRGENTREPPHRVCPRWGADPDPVGGPAGAGRRRPVSGGSAARSPEGRYPRPAAPKAATPAPQPRRPLPPPRSPACWAQSPS